MFMIGKKMKMTQIWKDDRIVPVTLISVEPNTVSIVRTKDKDGYEAVQLKLGRTHKEFRAGRGPKAEDAVSLNAGDNVEVSGFKEGDKVHVRGIMKGRGFQGVVKRYNFAGGPKTHGQKNRLRAPGSIGSTAPQRVWPGRRMAGHMGGTTVTVKNLKVVEVDPEKKTLAVKGAVPGTTGSILEIRVAPVLKKKNAK
jgi:large subunit ribosomal protein L3